ncbi:MAG TPA: chemotaxis protein CheW [Bacteroidales bacterium]|nr:chemotaxis protein CheW [Bacteroidales bacterium]
MNAPDKAQNKSYVTFTAGKENFAIAVDNVLEILLQEELTIVPDSSEMIAGIFNFRGNVVPVFKTSKRFNYKESEEEKMVIVIELHHENKNVLTGLLVNQVNDVVELNRKDIKPVPEIGYNPDFLEGYAEIDGKFSMILNSDKVFSSSDMLSVQPE